MQKILRIIAVAVLLTAAGSHSVAAFSVGATPMCYPTSTNPCSGGTSQMK